MKSRFKLSRKRIIAALAVGILALPAVGRTQATGSNASLADTLTWLTSFLPTATGGQATVPNGTPGGPSVTISETTTLDPSSSCNITLRTDELTPAYGSTTLIHQHGYETFSLSDIDPASVVASPDSGSNSVSFTTRGRAPLVLFSHRDDQSPVRLPTAYVSYFADPASAQRVANAFQHAAQLCANAAPF